MSSSEQKKCRRKKDMHGPEYSIILPSGYLNGDVRSGERYRVPEMWSGVQLEYG